LSLLSAFAQSPASLPDALPAALADPLNATTTLADDALPSLDEVMHWSHRLSHAALIAAIGVGAALLLHFVLFRLLRRLARRSTSSFESLALVEFNHSVRAAMVTAGLAAASAGSHLVAVLWGSIAMFVVPAVTGWVVFSAMRTLADMLDQRTDAFDDILAARSRRTRITLLSRSAGVVIVVVTVAMIMLGIPAVRHIGATLIASAGLIGLAVGAAAQPALKSLIAGLQIAFTQPIRIGDYVVFDGESGRVEDIRFSYVVIRSADERRLIVPTPRFLDTTFQNWTRVTGITGHVLLPISPGTDLAPIRAAYERLLAARPEWDQRSASLLVTDARPGVVELKLMMSARGPDDLANLRLAMREAMLEWLRAEMPAALCVTFPVVPGATAAAPPA